MDWFQTGKRLQQSCILSPWLFNFYAEYIIQKARLDEAQAGIKIASRNTNNLSYADGTFMTESEDELKSLLKKVKKESEKAGLNFNLQKMKTMASFMANRWGYTETGQTFFSQAPKSLQMVIAAMKLKDSCSSDENLWPT